MDWIQGTWLDLYVGEFTVRFLIVGAIALPLSVALRRWLPLLWRRHSRQRPDGYETALLAGGVNRLCQAVLADLRERDEIELIGGDVQFPPKRDERPPLEPRHEIERKTLEAARKVTPSDTFKEIMAGQARALQGSLVQKGHWLTDSQQTMVRLLAFAPAALWLAFGALRFAIGLADDEAVAHLGILIVFGLAAATPLLFGTPRTPTARKFLRAERRRYRRDFHVLAQTDPTAQLMAVALFGPDADDPLIELFAPWWAQRRDGPDMG